MRAPKISEKAWQQQVIGLATALGWKHQHQHDSRRSAAGWPDLALCRPPRMVYAELKTDDGKVTPEQDAWLTDLASCPPNEVFVWRPADWDEVAEVLKRGES